MLEAIFINTITEITVDGLAQWDKGQQLKISLSSLPASFEVHFSNKYSKEAYVVEATSSNGVSIVDIPNIVLTKPFDVVAWVYETITEEVGETIAQINLPLMRRAKPSNYVYEEDEVLDYRTLEKRINDIENKGVSDATIKQAIEDYIAEHPITGSGTGENGEDGKDGFSPIATVTQTATGAIITIEDAKGTTTATISNGEQGEKGEKGDTPQRGVDYWTETDKTEMKSYCKQYIDSEILGGAS